MLIALKLKKSNAGEAATVKKEKKSLYLFRKDNRFRLWMTTIAESKSFDYFILLLIVITSITLALETPGPLKDPTSDETIMKIIDYSSTGIFLIELIVKVISTGFIDYM